MHSLVAERRHSSITRYAKRSVACRDSPRHQPLRAGGTPLPRHPSDCASPSSATHRFAPSARCIIAIGEKTAEERFNMLARGWLAYPVMPTHTLLPPKSGCINVIPRFALSRRRATALFHNPVCKAQRSVPGFSSTPTSACRRYATSPPSAVASPIGLPQRRNTSPCEKTAEERFHTLARGWLAYPVMPTHALLPPKSGCRRPRRAKKDRWLGFQPSVSVSLRSAVRLLVDNTTLFDTSLLACKVAQIVQFCTTHFTKLVDCDAVDKR